MNLERAWVDAVTELGGDPVVAEASAADLAHRYTEPHRRYHRTSHVEAVLEDASRLAVVEAIDARDRAVLMLAVCAHDVVYDAQPGLDEAASAEWARRHVTAARIDAATTTRVMELVLTTLTHTFSEDDVLATLLSDADLAILGAEESLYDAYVSAVRDEFAAVPDDLWRLGRRHVLEELLAKEVLFSTAMAFEEYEARARRNVSRELLTLQD